MFITEPRHKLSLPFGLATPRTLYWRAFSLPCAHPWLLVSMLFGEAPDSYTEISGIFWNEDLLGHLELKQDGRLVGLQCVTPPTNPNGQWSIRPIHSIWRVRCDASNNETIVLRDAIGNDVPAKAGDVGVSKITDLELIMEVESA